MEKEKVEGVSTELFECIATLNILEKALRFNTVCLDGMEEVEIIEDFANAADVVLNVKERLNKCTNALD